MNTQRKSQPFLSQIGSAVVIVCFFLPWASCQGEEVKSGAEMGGVAWLVLFAAGIIVASVHYFGSIGSLSRARNIVRVCAVLALAIMVERYFSARNDLGELLKIEYGSIGTLGGLLLALYGSLFLDDPEEGPPGPTPKRQTQDSVD